MDPIHQLKEQTTSYSAGSPVPQRDSMSYRDLDWNMTREGLDNFTHAVVDMYNSRYDNSTPLTKSQIADAVGIRQGTLDTVLKHAESQGIEVKKSKISNSQKEELYQAREENDNTTFRELGERYGISASYAGRIYRQQRDAAQTPQAEQTEEVSETGLVVAQPLELAIADYTPDTETGRPHVIDIEGEVVGEEIISGTQTYRSRTPLWAKAAAAVLVVGLGAATLGYALKNAVTSANASPVELSYSLVENNPIIPIQDRVAIEGGSSDPPKPNPNPDDGETMYAQAEATVPVTPIQPVKPIADLESTTEVAYETAKDAPKAVGADYDPLTASVEDIGSVLAGMEQEMDALEKSYETPEPTKPLVEEPKDYVTKVAETNAPVVPIETPVTEQAETTPYQMRGFAHPANGHAYIQTIEGGAWKSDNRHAPELNIPDTYITGELGSKIFTESDLGHLPVYDPETRIASNGGDYKQGPKGHGRKWTRSWGFFDMFKGALGKSINPRRDPETLVRAQMAKEQASMPFPEIPAEEVPTTTALNGPVNDYISSLRKNDTPLYMLISEVETEFVHYADNDPETAAVRLAAYETLMDERTVEWHQHNVKVFGEKGARKAFHRFKGHAEENLSDLLTRTDADARLIALAQEKLASFQHAEATLSL